MYFVLKTLITALVVAGVSELSKRYSLIAAVLVSLPLTSILAFIWIYYDTRDNTKLIELSYSIAWLILPSVLFFIALPILLKNGIKFPLALFLSCAIMSLGYTLFITLRKLF